MKICAILVLGCCLASLASAESDLKFPELNGYKDVTITAVKSDHVRIIHSVGAGRISFDDLPKELRDRFQKSREDAIAERVAAEIELERATLQHRFSKSKIELSGQVIRIEANGVFLTDLTSTNGERVRIPAETEKKKIKTYPMGRDHPYARKQSKTRVVDVVVSPERWEDAVKEWKGIAFVRCEPRHILDGEKLKFEVWPVAPLRFVNTFDQNKSIRQFSVSRDEAHASLAAAIKAERAKKIKEDERNRIVASYSASIRGRLKASRTKLWGTIVEVLPNGVRLEFVSCSNHPNKEREIILNEKAIVLCDTGGLIDGEDFQCVAWPLSSPVTLKSGRTLQAYTADATDAAGSYGK